MTNAELIQKIRAEIESLKSIEYPCDNSQQETGFFNALDIMTDFLDTLESEKPIDGLEEEVKRYYSDNFAYISSDQPTLSILTNIARHFYELGSSEKPNNHEGLDEAAEGIYKTRFYTRADDFKAGAEWAMDNLPKWRESSKEYYTDKPKVYEGFGQFKLFWKDRVIDINKVFETLPKK